MARQRRPQLGGAASVIEVPDADSAKAGRIDKVVLQPQRRGVVPIELAGAVERRVEPRIPSLLTRRIVGVAVRCVAARLDGWIAALLGGVQVRVRGYCARWILIGRRT